MLGERIEAVYENGVFRPLQPIHMPEHQRVTLVLPTTEEDVKNGTPADDEFFDDDVGYVPLPLQQYTTIRVRLTPIGELPPVPYPVDLDELEQE